MVFPASLPYTERKSAVLRAQNQGGDTDIPFTVTVYLFLAENTIPVSLFKIAKKKVYRWIFRRYIERKSAIEGTTNQEGDTDVPFTITVPLSGKNRMSLFSLIFL